jgi:hypothetical protein
MPESQTSSPDRTPKRSYRAPELRDLGSLGDLTLAGAGVNTADGGGYT